MKRSVYLFTCGLGSSQQLAGNEEDFHSFLIRHAVGCVAVLAPLLRLVGLPFYFQVTSTFPELAPCTP